MAASFILTAFLALSLILSALLVPALAARSGFRARHAMMPLGLAAGLLIGPLEHAVNGKSVLLLDWAATLELQFIASGMLRAVTMAACVSIFTAIFIQLISPARRRGDIWSAAIGMGAGLGLASTWAIFHDSQAGWPPLMLITAMINIPFHICFASLVAGAILRARFKAQTKGFNPFLLFAVAIAAGGSYHAILTATLKVGHWLAWFEPPLAGAMWLALIFLCWLTALAVMAYQDLAAMPASHHPASGPAKPAIALRPGLWKFAAFLILTPAIFAFAATWYWSLDTALGRVMIYTLLSAPLMAGSIILRTGLALEPQPLKFRLF